MQGHKTDRISKGRKFFDFRFGMLITRHFITTMGVGLKEWKK